MSAASARLGALDRLAVGIASLGLVGFFPVAPATLASAVATAFLALVYPVATLAALVLVVVLLAGGVWACGRLERLYGQDPAAAVLDEVCGMAITLAWVPISPATLVMGFLFFRVFDILKVPPGRAVERLPGGWGIMLDDVVAGIYAAAALRGLLWLWPEPRLQAWHLVALGVAALALVILRKPLMRRYAKPRTRLGVRREGEPR